MSIGMACVPPSFWKIEFFKLIRDYFNLRRDRRFRYQSGPVSHDLFDLWSPPPNPVRVGGPLSASSASSFVNRSTAALAFDRTPTRSITSAISGEGSPPGPS